MILGIIPARGGSKGISRKNLRRLDGHPLVGWAVMAAKASKLLDRFVVSTEDEEIAAVARAYRAEVLPRPLHLASDDSTLIEVVQHILQHIDAEVIVLLNPTSPIRVNNIIDRAIERFLSSGADSLATGYMSKHYEWGTVHEMPRQRRPGFFLADGCVYVHRAEVLQSGRWYGEKLERMIVPHYYNFDIDEEEDLWAVEGILSNLKERGYYGDLKEPLWEAYRQ